MVQNVGFGDWRLECGSRVWGLGVLASDAPGSCGVWLIVSFMCHSTIGVNGVKEEGGALPLVVGELTTQF